MAAIAATLARYSHEIITSVTHPVYGLPSRKSWLPTVKEVFEACEQLDDAEHQNIKREKRIREQLAEREAEDRTERPTYEQLKAKYGDNWGLTVRPTVDPADDLRARQRTERMILREYESAGIEPQYTSDGLLISLSLARLIA